MKNLRILIIVAVAGLLMVSTSFATTCCQSYFTLDWVSLTPEFDGYPDTAPHPYEGYNSLLDPYGNLLTQSYDSTLCFGVFPGGNDDQHGLSSPNPNIGHLGDGLLNGQLADGGVIGTGPIDPTFTQSGDSSPNYFTGMEFIVDVDNDLQNLGYIDGSGVQHDDVLDNDPGWIHLAHFDGDNGSVVYDTAGEGMTNALDISALLTLTFTFDPTGRTGNSGRWTLTTHPDVIDEAQDLLGNSTFDRLAVSFKAGNAFVVQSLNFKTIFGIEDNPYLNFMTPYQLSGTFATGDLENHDISHMNIWARDPSDKSVIPEPSTLILLGAGLLGLGFCARRRRK